MNFLRETEGASRDIPWGEGCFQNLGNLGNPYRGVLLKSQNKEVNPIMKQLWVERQLPLLRAEPSCSRRPQSCNSGLAC